MFRIATVTAFLGLMIVSSSMSRAEQTAQEVLQAAAEKLNESPTLRASMTIHGEGAEMFRNMLPKGQARVILRRVETEGSVHWQGRVTGKATTGNPQEKDPIDIDFVQSKETQRWIDHAQKKVFDMVPARAMSARSPAYSGSKMLLPSELMQPQPFRNEFDAEELALLPAEQIDGVPCDVIEVKYPKPAGSSRSNAGKPQQIKLFFGQEDHLLRRVERVNGADSFKMVVVLEFSNWETGAPLDDKDFELPVPDGYELVEAKPVSSTVRPTRTEPASGAPKPADPERHADEATEQFEPAPEFSFNLASGEAVTLESLRGTTAVLYFWGTWCLECRDFNPLVSKLAEEVADQPVRVFGLAVRERDPASAKDLVKLRDYRFEVAPDAAAAAGALHVVYYPTFVVIDPAGGLVGTEAVRRGSTLDGTMARVRELIRKASPGVNLQPGPKDPPPAPEDESADEPAP